MKADAKPSFTDVATLIAKGPPPEWLVLGLDYFGEFIRDNPFSRADRKQTQKIITGMDDSARYLRKNLPLFRYLVPGQSTAPKDVALALTVLPRIEKLLVVEAWRVRTWQARTRKLQALDCLQRVSNRCHRYLLRVLFLSFVKKKSAIGADFCFAL